MFDDTNKNIPESLETLQLQQKALIDGRRSVQMFPNGTMELALPQGQARYVGTRGVFHFNPNRVTQSLIEIFSSQGRENEILCLGPYSKSDIAQRVANGEKLTCITEFTPDGIELRSAVGTDATIDEQLEYFEITKEPGNVIEVGKPPARVAHLYKDC